jgi:hypothetical protein
MKFSIEHWIDIHCHSKTKTISRQTFYFQYTEASVKDKSLNCSVTTFHQDVIYIIGTVTKF